MKKQYVPSLFSLVPAVAMLLLMVSCDDGPVMPEYAATDAKVVYQVEGRVSGLDTWPANYTIALAAFSNEGDYALYSKPVKRLEGDKISVSFDNLPQEADRVEICVLDRIRQRISTIYELPATAFSETDADTLRINIPDVAASMFDAVQKDVFTPTCSNCHGRSNKAAAGLYLTEGKSYEALLNKPSQVAGGTLVIPGDAENSVLHQVVSSDLTTGRHYDHTKEVVNENTRRLIEQWIVEGAQK